MHPELIDRYSLAGEEQYWEDALECSNFTIQPYRRVALSNYYNRYYRDAEEPLWDDDVADVLEQIGIRSVEAPRSIYHVNLLFKALAKYAPDVSPHLDMLDEDVKAGIKLAYACFAKPKDSVVLEALPFTPMIIHQITSNPKGSPGLTNYGMTKAESETRAYERGIQIIKGQKSPEPCLAFKRTQFNNKTRLVWGYPYSMTAIEGLFARPLIDHFVGTNSAMSFGGTTGQLGTRLRVSSYNNRFAYSTDVSSFDSSISGELIHVAFKILKTWFDLDKVEPTSGAKYRDIFKIVETYFITTPIVMPNGKVYYGKRHGVPSGSYFTQFVDTVCNCIICGAISNHFNMAVSKATINILGDDLLFWSNSDVSLKEIAEFGSALFHIKLNEAKSSKFRYDEIIHYLGRDWDDGVPTLSEEEIVKRMVQPENFRKYSKDVLKRRREVHNLILSYASVYYQASDLLWRIWNNRYATWNVGPDDLERNWVGVDEWIVNPEFLSGLIRYQIKYQHVAANSTTPTAIRFWK